MKTAEIAWRPVRASTAMDERLRPFEGQIECLMGQESETHRLAEAAVPAQ